MKEVLQLLLQTGRYDLPEGLLDLGVKEQSQQSMKKTKELRQHLVHTGRYDLPGGLFELGMTERSQQPLRKPHVIKKKKNPSNEKKSLKGTTPLQSKPKPTHRSIFEISEENNETSEEHSGEETSEENYDTKEENYKEKENGKDPTFEEYHSIKDKREDDNSESNFTNDSTRVNPLPDWPIHVVGNQPLDCSRCQLKPVKEEMYI